MHGDDGREDHKDVHGHGRCHSGACGDIDDNCVMVGVDNYCLPLHQLRRKGQETPKKEKRSSKGECNTADQTIILGLQIFLDH